MLLGGAVLAVGLAMTVLPGPAVVVIPMGLLLLATEFFWARRWIVKLRRRFPMLSRVLPSHRSPPQEPRVEARMEPSKAEGREREES